MTSRLGRSLPPRSELFPAEPSWVSRCRRPPHLSVAGSSSRGLTPSSEFQPHRPARRAHAASTFLGVSSLHRDASARSPLAGRVPALPTFRPQCFAHSRRLAPPDTLPACFIRLPRPRFALQGFSPAISRTSSSLAVSLLPLATLTCVRVASHAPGPAASTSGLCSDHRSVACAGLLSQPRPDPLLRFLLPEGFLRAPWNRFHGSSAHDLAAGSSQ